MDEVEQMKECLKVLRSVGNRERERDGEDVEEDEEEQKESAMELLSELCENLDNARGICVCVNKNVRHFYVVMVDLLFICFKCVLQDRQAQVYSCRC